MIDVKQIRANPEALREAVRRRKVDPHRADIDELARIASAHAIDAPHTQLARDRDAWLDLLLVHRVEPNLGHQRPVILYHYPSTQAALARVTEGDPPVALRLELYVRGIELANGYEELTDPIELRRRNEQTNRQRSADGTPFRDAYRAVGTDLGSLTVPSEADALAAYTSDGTPGNVDVKALRRRLNG